MEIDATVRESGKSQTSHPRLSNLWRRRGPGEAAATMRRGRLKYRMRPPREGTATQLPITGPETVEASAMSSRQILASLQSGSIDELAVDDDSARSAVRPPAGSEPRIVDLDRPPPHDDCVGSSTQPADGSSGPGSRDPAGLAPEVREDAV